MARDYGQSQSRAPNSEGLTNTPNPRLFTDNHTLQHLCTFEMPQILRDIPDSPIFKRIFPKYRIENRESMTYFID